MKKIFLLGILYFTQVSGALANSGDIGSYTPPSTLPTGSLPDLLDQLANFLLTGAGSIAALLLIIGAIQYATSAGEEEAELKAKRTLKWAVFGLFIALISYTIVRTVVGILAP
jgi:hypothetical protein